MFEKHFKKMKIIFTFNRKSVDPTDDDNNKMGKIKLTKKFLYFSLLPFANVLMVHSVVINSDDNLWENIYPTTDKLETINCNELVISRLTI